MIADFGQVAVDRVGLTTVAAPQQDGSTMLWAAVGLWADLSCMRRDGHLTHGGEGNLDVLMAVDAYLMPDPTRIAVVVTPGVPVDHMGLASPDSPATQANPDSPACPREDSPPDGPDLDTGFAAATPAHSGLSRPEAAAAAVQFAASTTAGDRYTLVLPTTAVALVMALSTTSAGVQMVVTDGPAPTAPESVALAPQDLAAVVVIPAEVVHDHLCGLVTRGLHAPLPTVSAEETQGEMTTLVDSMRGMLWSLLAGTAAGQDFTFERLVGLGVWAYEMATRSQPDTARLAALFEVTEQAQVLSMVAASTAGASADLSALAPSMAPLAGAVTARIDPKVFAALDGGQPFAEVADEVGLARALPALGTLVAARAAAITASTVYEGATASLVLATWLDEGASDEPWWVLPATQVAQSRYDVAIVTDLLLSPPAPPVPADPSTGASTTAPNEVAGWSPMLRRYLHTLAEAVLTLDMDEDDLRTALQALDVRPAHFADASDLAHLLLSEGLASAQAEDGQCPACAGALPLAQADWSPARLVAACAALLPLLADVDAADQDLPVGDDSWVRRREQFLQHWLLSVAD